MKPINEILLKMMSVVANGQGKHGRKVKKYNMNPLVDLYFFQVIVQNCSGKYSGPVKTFAVVI